MIASDEVVVEQRNDPLIDRPFDIERLAAAPVVHRLLVCAPAHFAVDYVINPWMQAHVHTADATRAQRQWDTLVTTLRASGADLAHIAGIYAQPDMVFTANAGLVLGKDFVPSRFRHHERRGEEAPFTEWFRRAGFQIHRLPQELAFEGAGDALLDRATRRLWMGYGHRSEFDAAAELERLLDIDVVPLQLVDPRFYHLDTCFCPLRGGYLMYYPEAFTLPSRLKIQTLVAPERRIEISEYDALNFACNAVDLDRHLLLNRASPVLEEKLSSIGYQTLQVPLDEFLKAGGAAKCLTLRLDE